ncbi:MAG TPA: CPXCG motif-containing cysteine-rich protein [Pseudomonadales bacterium]
MSLAELHTYTVNCPYCGEAFTTSIEPLTERQTYYEDCQVCCHPIFFSVSCDSDNGGIQVTISRDDE